VNSNDTKTADNNGGEESSDVSKEYHVVECDTEEEKEATPHISSADVLNLD